MILVFFSFSLSAAPEPVDYEVAYSFMPGLRPGSSRIIEASDGALYGTTSLGDNPDDAALFKLNKDGSGFTVLHTFSRTNSDAFGPSGPLTQAANGALYGTTRDGGAHGRGTVFTLNMDGSGYHTIHEFTSFGEGSEPKTGVIVGDDGALYGTTLSGGGVLGGVIFKLNLDGSGFQIIHTLSYTYSERALIEGSDGLLYGTAGKLIYRLNKNGGQYMVVHALTDQYGRDLMPISVLEASDGFLYGLTGSIPHGAAMLFRLHRDGSGLILHNLWSPTNDLRVPLDVVEGRDGALYGATSGGGATNGGTIFKVNKDGSAVTVLHSFGVRTNDGNAPSTGLTRASDGAFYGITVNGGDWAFGGTIYRFQTPPGLTLAIMEGGAHIRFRGFPNRTYDIHRADTVSGPWSMITRHLTQGDGNGAYTDPSPLQTTAYYRVYREP